MESEQEAARISECAVETNTTGRIAFRINPDVDPQTHKYISTGKKENKFGLDISRTEKAYETTASLPNIEIAGIHMHIGSQLLSAEPFAEALQKLRDFCMSLKQKYPTFQHIDIGGGIGIQYKPEQEALDPKTYASLVIPLLKEIGMKVVMEPGRNLVGNAGILVSRVQYVKDNAFKKFIVVDAAMNDLIRPSLYQAHHEILAVTETSSTVHGDIVGPICESGDFLAADRDLPDAKQGDLIAALSAGSVWILNGLKLQQPAKASRDYGRQRFLLSGQNEGNVRRSGQGARQAEDSQNSHSEGNTGVLSDLRMDSFRPFYKNSRVFTNI